jgi:hypothetical protein
VRVQTSSPNLPLRVDKPLNERNPSEMSFVWSNIETAVSSD